MRVVEMNADCDVVNTSCLQNEVRTITTTLTPTNIHRCTTQALCTKTLIIPVMYSFVLPVCDSMQIFYFMNIRPNSSDDDDNNWRCKVSRVS